MKLSSQLSKITTWKGVTLRGSPICKSDWLLATFGQVQHKRAFSVTRISRRDPLTVFNREVKEKQRDRAATNPETSRIVEYIRNEVANRMAERLLVISSPQDILVDVGSGAGNLEQAICGEREDPQDNEILRKRIKKIIMTEMSRGLLYRDVDPEMFPFNRELNITRVQVDEEKLFTPALYEAIQGTNALDSIPYSDTLFENTVSAVVSNMSLHWVNDLPGLLQRIKYMLKPDGLFMASMLGGDSLFELRTSLQIAEMDTLGRIAPRLSPLADIRDMGNLLQSAGYNLITIDVDDIIVSYPDMQSLLFDLRDAGESNAVFNRPHYLPRSVIKAAEETYKSMHANEDGTLPATYRIIYMIAWKPGPTQPKPLERGSAQKSLKEVLSTK
ncbi:hypothetical protein V1511DRAFT_76841 [Dipodascopsis uninucleata]